MKPADKLWLEQCALRSLGKSGAQAVSPNLLTQHVNAFLDDLTGLLMEFCSMFNELVKNDSRDLQVRALKLGNPRPGVMILRSKEKLIITLDGPFSLKAKLVQVRGIQEHTFDILEFEPQQSVDGDLGWVSSEGKPINPELVTRRVVGPFLVHGGKAFASQTSAQAESNL